MINQQFHDSGKAILFLGPPGSGKGTQCKKLAQKLNLPHLSSGDLLRHAVCMKTDAGLAAKQYMDKGELVPDSVLLSMFKEELSKPSCKSGFILDGFPRNLAQAKALDAMLIELNLPLRAVILLELSDDLLIKRIIGRLTCQNKNCAAVFHVEFTQPKSDNLCDFCHSPLIRRADDQEEVVRVRLNTYREQTKPLVEYYDSRHILKTIDGHEAPETVFENIIKVL